MAGPTSPPRQSLAGVKNRPVAKYDCDARWAQPQRANSWSAELPRRLPSVRPSSRKLRRALGDRLAGVPSLMDPLPPCLRTGRASRLVKLNSVLTANRPDLKQPPLSDLASQGFGLPVWALAPPSSASGWLCGCSDHALLLSGRYVQRAPIPRPVSRAPRTCGPPLWTRPCVYVRMMVSWTRAPQSP